MEDYVKFLKEKGLSPQDIRMALDIKANGITLTKAIYKFNKLYDSGKIDGFPDSSIQLLESFYGKKLKKMKFKTLYKKVLTLQLTLVSNPDEEDIKESIGYYLS